MEMIVLLAAAAYAIAILFCGRLKAVTQHKPRSSNYQNREYAGKFKKLNEPAEPLSDSEYNQIRKSYRTTTAAAIVIPFLLLVLALITAFALWDTTELLYMILYVVIVSASYIVSVIFFVKNKKALSANRDLFTKKQAYLISSDSADLYRVKNDNLKKTGTAYYVMIAFPDDKGKQLTYKYRVDHKQYLKINENKKCYAVLYKGIFSTIIA